jgi:hypothetical protein
VPAISYRRVCQWRLNNIRQWRLDNIRFWQASAHRRPL